MTCWDPAQEAGEMETRKLEGRKQEIDVGQMTGFGLQGKSLWTESECNNMDSAFIYK